MSDAKYSDGFSTNFGQFRTKFRTKISESYIQKPAKFGHKNAEMRGPKTHKNE